MNILNLFDHYSFRARLQPALLVLVPGAFAIFAWTGASFNSQSALWTLFGTAGGTFLLAMLARNFGKKTEPGLWISWGGTPTTQLLRHSGPANPVARGRWHKNLAKILGTPFPSAAEEVADPTSADQIYDAAVKLQIGKTRDAKKYRLLYNENVNYGFCRNLYAMRPFGLIISAVGLIVSCVAGLWFLKRGGDTTVPWICSLVDLVFVFWWTFVIKSTWVKIPAFAYAQRLFESTESTSVRRKPSSELTSI